MDDLQATIEIAVDLGKFYNVDLFQRGFYQVAVKLINPIHPQAKLEVIILKPGDRENLCPAKKTDDKLGAISKCVQILYKRDECQLMHTFLFRVHCLIDSHAILECLTKLKFELECTLFFSSANDGDEDILKDMEAVSKRNLRLNIDPIYGLYAYNLVLFDYGYMAGVDICVHGSLVALHQPLMTMPGISTPSGRLTPGVEPATLESILFRPLPGMSAAQAASYDVRISTAISVHAKIVKVLLSVYGHMQNHYLKLLRKLPKTKAEEIVLVTLGQVSSKLFPRQFNHDDHDTLSIDSSDISYKLRDMTLVLKNFTSLEEVVNQVNMNLASTCSLLLALWSHVLETACLNKQVRRDLSAEYHRARVQRFQCGFFTLDFPRASVYQDTRQQIYTWMALETRTSNYFIDLPPLKVDCVDADGDPESLPVIFEDVYTNSCKEEPVFQDNYQRNLFSRSLTTSSPTATTHQVISPNENETKEKASEQSSDLSARKVSSTLSNESTIMRDEKVLGNGSSTKLPRKGIFRKKKNSIAKERFDRLSVSDDETTKLTLSEFLSSIENTQHGESSPTRTASHESVNHAQRKRKGSRSKKRHSNTEKSKKFHTLLTHRRSLDERAQRLIQLMKRNKRNSDNTKLSRSLSYSFIDQTRDSESTVSSHSSVHSDSYDDLREYFPSSELSKNPAVKSVVEDYYKTISNGTHSPHLRGIMQSNSRKEQSKFRMFLRSETSEEPDPDTHHKSLPSREMSMNLIQCKMTNIVDNKSPAVKIPLSNRDSCTEGLLGIPKAKSYSSGISTLLQDKHGLSNHDQEFPRPHLNMMHPDHIQTEIRASKTVLGGLDTVWKGMGFHPGGTTLTTSDLTPFDEPEPIMHAWKANDTQVKDQVHASNLTSSEENSFADNLEDTVISTADITTNLKENTIESEPPTDDSVASDEVELGDQTITAENNISEQRACTLPPTSSDCKLDKMSVASTNLPMDEEVFPNITDTLAALEVDHMRTHSMRGLAGSLELSEEEAPLYSDSLLSKVETPNPKKLPQSNGDAVVVTDKYNLTNTIPTIRSQLGKRHVAEKSRLFGRLQFPGQCYSDIPEPIKLYPYLSHKSGLGNLTDYSDSCHLVVCVHGLGGTSNDLRLIRTYLQLALPINTNISFLMSKSNQNDTYADIDTMTDRLANEIIDDIQYHFSHKQPQRISFVGHSLGCLLIRSVVAHEKLRHLRSRFHTFLSLSGPHLGTVFNNSALVNTGLWLIQKWKKSACLLQLACKDHADLKKTYIYKLSKKKGLEYFKNVLLVASAQDRYVPYHSARIEMCKQAFRDKTLGPAYQEMLNNIMKPVLNKPNLNLVRYHVVHWLPATAANSMIGRAAHIAVVDSEIFLEKFFLVAALKYFV